MNELFEIRRTKSEENFKTNLQKITQKTNNQFTMEVFFDLPEELRAQLNIYKRMARKKYSYPLLCEIPGIFKSKNYFLRLH